MSIEYLIAGLGNPGQSYQGTRHNLGFLAIDAIAEEHSPSSVPKIKHHCEVREVLLGLSKVLLCKPLTYMNRSGQGISPLLSFYKLSPSRLYVIHDDLALPLGALRVKKGGGSGGHNGLKSIDSCVGVDYWRLRLGIDHPGPGRDVSDYVLGTWGRSEVSQWAPLISVVSEKIDQLLGQDTPTAWVQECQKESLLRSQK